MNGGLKNNINLNCFYILLLILGCSEGFKPDDDHFTFNNIYHFYSQQSEITNPGEYVFLYKDLPDDPVALVKVVQRICIHEAYFSSRGIRPPNK